MYLVSSCLAGFKCRYDGKDNVNERVVELVNQGRAIPICPEQLGGLATPRVACEIIYNKENKLKVMNKEGQDQTEAFMIGAKHSVAIAKALDIKKAILKAKSPSCGCGKIYNGMFEGKLIVGNGLTAQALIEEGIQVYTEEDFDKVMSQK